MTDDPRTDPQDGSPDDAGPGEPDPNGASRRWTPGRILVAVIVVVAVVLLLFTVVFPRVERYLENPTLDTDTAQSAAILH